MQKGDQDFKGTTFSTVTIDDLTNPSGLHLDLRNINRVNHCPSMFIPATFPLEPLRPFLCQQLQELDKVWSFNTETGCRARINMILCEALQTQQNEDINLGVFCEVKNDWTGTGFSYSGNVDYMIGSGSMLGPSHVDSCLLAVEAKREWPDTGIAQVLAEAGCLQQNRILKGLTTPVFAMLTNATLFQFFAIDTNSTVYSSGVPLILDYADDGTYQTSTNLPKILHWLRWFISCMRLTSPRCSPALMPQGTVARNIRSVQNCFRDVST
jgi:hypothetical protein